MSDFSFTFPIYEAIDLKLTLTVSGSPFDLDAFLAGGSAATFRLELDTGSITRRVITTTDVTREPADATNVATIHLAQNEVPAIGTWTATLTAGPQVWAGTAVVMSLGTPTVTAGGATTSASSETVTATGSTTARALKDRAADVVNVTDFGAVGDGVHDDTASIQAALAAGAGREVRFRDGATFLVSAPLPPASGTKVTGKATIKAKNAGTFAAVFDLIGVSNVTITDMEIDGQTNAGGTVGAKFGVRVTGGTNVVARDLNIHDTYGEAIRFDGGSGHAVFGGRVVDCGRASSTEDHGIALLAATANLTHVRVEGVHVSGANRKGIAGYSTGGLTLADVAIVGNTVRTAALGGIFVATNPASPGPILNVSITGNVIESSYVGIEVANVTGATVAGNAVRSATGADGINVDSCVAISITGNVVDLSYRKGIAVLGSYSQTTDAIVSGNVVTRSNQGAAGITPGIHFNNVAYSSIAGNVITDHGVAQQTYGVLEDGASNNNQIIDNVVLGATSYGHYTIGANTVTRIASLGGVAASADPANGGTATPDTAVVETFTYSATAGVASFTVAAPTRAPYVGKRIWITVRNVSGGALTVTWDAAYKIAWTNPANGKRRTAVLSWDGTNWVQETMHTDAPS